MKVFNKKGEELQYYPTLEELSVLKDMLAESYAKGECTRELKLSSKVVGEQLTINFSDEDIQKMNIEEIMLAKYI